MPVVLRVDWQGTNRAILGDADWPWSAAGNGPGFAFGRILNILQFNQDVVGIDAVVELRNFHVLVD
jgi:hypothetical protein